MSDYVGIEYGRKHREELGEMAGKPGFGSLPSLRSFKCAKCKENKPVAGRKRSKVSGKWWCADCVKG